jgi:hypothetical protein
MNNTRNERNIYKSAIFTEEVLLCVGRLCKSSRQRPKKTRISLQRNVIRHNHAFHGSPLLHFYINVPSRWMWHFIKLKIVTNFSLRGAGVSFVSVANYQQNSFHPRKRKDFESCPAIQSIHGIIPLPSRPCIKYFKIQQKWQKN